MVASESLLSSRGVIVISLGGRVGGSRDPPIFWESAVCSVIVW